MIFAARCNIIKAKNSYKTTQTTNYSAIVHHCNYCNKSLIWYIKTKNIWIMFLMLSLFSICKVYIYSLKGVVVVFSFKYTHNAYAISVGIH